uniref:Zinc finger, CCHC-type n=1 Tax=Tanacetum cinerariifolium TaxID=118510 RepID=A0A6L2KRF3_TANCI|nr:zinc finger, CCHC-type [Tanacetum cinerariifolium]
MLQMKSRDVAFWKEAINDEMDSITGNNTWVLADLPPGCKPLGCKWIFKRKLKMDVKTAFLIGKLEEKVYRNQPQGFIMPGNENKVCKLNKSLYGLKQAPKQWHQKIDEVALSNGYLLNQAANMYIANLMNLVMNLVDLTKEFLSSRFSMKDMGEADVIMGIRIKHKSNGIAISQSHYIENVLEKFSYFDCTRVSTPMDTSEKPMPNNGQVVSQLEYSRVIGCLIDASWISNTEDNSSTSGWVFLLGDGVISWASKKQTCITGSTTESEFVALAAGKEAEWLKNLLLEIPL